MRTETNYSDRTIFCAKCRKHLFDVRMDAQILILESGLIAFGFLAYQCGSCGRNGRFLSPILPDELPTIDNQVPDIQTITHRSAALKKKMKEFGYRPKQQDADEQIKENFAVT
jgi:hypothetical protein